MSNKKNIDIEAYADIFKALSNPNRLRIFSRLATCCTPGTVGIMDDRSSAYVGELGNELEIVPSTVSHHIKELRRVGLIKTRRRGQNIECWVDPDILKELENYFRF
ncbi:MAG: helix-turn-helix transcriptional regulator [Desulfobacteraceae bacterium]|nr:helix-turn-helix transcriptional regulator [Desulfobacteraceae bacterium]